MIFHGIKHCATGIPLFFLIFSWNSDLAAQENGSSDQEQEYPSNFRYNAGEQTLYTQRRR